jgi:O-antigen ligase
MLLIAGLISAPSLDYSFFKPRDWLILASMASYALSQLFGILIHELSVSEFDRPLRFILAGIALLYLLNYPPRPDFFWAGIGLGAIGAGLWALWQVVINETTRAGGFTMIIQFGNISLLLGLISLLGIIWSIADKKKYAMSFFLIATLSGITGSILSGTRGGWIAIPFAIIGIFYVFRHKFKKIHLFAASCTLTIIVIGLYLIPSTSMSDMAKCVFRRT